MLSDIQIHLFNLWSLKSNATKVHYKCICVCIPFPHKALPLYNIYCTFVRCMEISLVWTYKSLSLQFVCINSLSTERESVWSVHIYAGMKPTKCLMLYYRKANMHYHTQHSMFSTTLQKQLNLLSLALFILLLQVYIRVWSLYFLFDFVLCAFNGTIPEVELYGIKWNWKRKYVSSCII